MVLLQNWESPPMVIGSHGPSLPHPQGKFHCVSGPLCHQGREPRIANPMPLTPVYQGSPSAGPSLLAGPQAGGGAPWACAPPASRNTNPDWSLTLRMTCFKAHNEQVSTSPPSVTPSVPSLYPHLPSQGRPPLSCQPGIM
jgi:hypothetical protein